jgi:hypothetical protein
LSNKLLRGYPGEASRGCDHRCGPGYEEAVSLLVQEYGLAERAAEFVYGRLQDHPEGDSRYEHRREVMQIGQKKTRRRKMERRHSLR